MEDRRATWLYPTTEIISSWVSYECSSDESLYNEMKLDVKSVILSRTDLDFSHLDIAVVENTDQECALVLPYYDGLEEVQSQVLADRDMSEIAGGEIAFSALTITGIIIGYNIGATTGTGMVVSAIIGGLVGASIAGALAASSTIGAVVGALGTHGKLPEGK